MKIGISITSAHDLSNIGDVRTGARWMIERAAAARQAGLDSLFIGDHHVTGTPYYQNTPMLGRLLAEWGDADVGALYILPLWQPVLLAEQVATLASIAEGRFIMQCGLGRGEDQFSAMGRDIRFRPSAFEECLNSLRQLWRGETVSSNGRNKFGPATIAPLPPEPIDVWIGANATVAIERAARMGDAWLAEPSLNIEQARAAFNTYRQARELLGLPMPETVAIRRDIHVAEHPNEADLIRQQVNQTGYRGFSTDALIIGDPDQMAAEFRQLQEIGYTDVIVRSLHPYQGHTIASLQRLSRVKAQLE